MVWLTCLTQRSLFDIFFKMTSTPHVICFIVYHSIIFITFIINSIFHNNLANLCETNKLKARLHVRKCFYFEDIIVKNNPRTCSGTVRTLENSNEARMMQHISFQVSNHGNQMTLCGWIFGVK